MRHSRLVILLLVLSSGVIDLVVWHATFMLPSGPASRPLPLIALLLALSLCQVGLMGTWLALGKQPTSWRLAGTSVVITAWSLLMAGLADRPIVAFWTILLLGQVLVLAGVLLILRKRGVSLVVIHESDSEGDGRSRVRHDTLRTILMRDDFIEEPCEEPAPWQFSLGQLFAWVTAAAIMLGMGTYSIRDYQYISSRGMPIIFAFGSVILGCPVQRHVHT